MSVSACVYLLVLGIAILSVYRHMYVHRASDSEHDVAVHRASNSEHDAVVDWHSIRCIFVYPVVACLKSKRNETKDLSCAIIAE
ncbi:hypothetical protein Q3G72_024343 [Acer saccharum]|nr:hypothetical protein Q3G72_024343 [Acer saccharum]